MLNAPTSTRRGLVLPNVFVQTLQANGVFFNRSEARALVERFQAPNGAVFASKFLQWVALSTPADHVNPELRFARLPQPYRRIVKVLERDIIDAAWEIIATHSERYKAEVAGGGAWTARSSSTSNDQQIHAADASEDDFQVVKKRVVKPGRRVPVATAQKAPRVVALLSHVCAPFAVAVISEQTPPDGNAIDSQHALQFVYTSTISGRNSGEAITFPLEWWAPDAAGSVGSPPSSEVTRLEVRVGSLSSLQPLFGSVGELGTATSWCLAIRLVKVTTTESAGDPATPSPTATMTMFGQISVLLIDIDALNNSISCRRFAVLNDADPGASAAVELSQDARFLSLSSAAQGISLARVPDVDQWKQQSSDAADPGAAGDANNITEGRTATDQGSTRSIPPIDMSNGPRLALSETIPGSPLNGEADRPPCLHFLVAPVTSVTSSNSKPFANAPITYALVACVGNRVLKFLLPDDPSCQSLAPVIRWEHLTRISASGVDASTELLAVACADGSLVVWNVLRDRDHSLLSTKMSTSSPSAVINTVLYRKGVVVALSTASQRVWFFDARKRRAPTVLRVVTPPPSSSLSVAQHSSAQPMTAATTITALVPGTNALGLPVAILQYSTGLAVLYDLRTARAIGSIRTSSPSLSVNITALCGVGRVASDKTQAEAVGIYAWDQLVPDLPAEDEEIGTLTGFGDAGNEALDNGRKDDPIALMYRLAGKSKPPPSPSSPKLKSPLPPSQPTSSTPSQLERARHKSAAVRSLGPQPLVPDWSTHFEQFCDERLDPQAMTEREAALMRRQRTILKAVAAAASS